MSEYTAGPWYATRMTGGYFGVLGPLNDRGSGGPVIARDIESEANARLIAAAPELLAACEASLSCIEAMVDRIDEECGKNGCLCTMPGCVSHSQTYRDNEITQLRAAIAKARGQER